ncbi:hypothetical protein BASA50_001356 [Batrachochytrium salamandrivorans]|uniref:Uncharacterized protein n=1 Tax=Batrachochytrium salamandrivorans TaxID=1357716 RepID=A0ABQ8EVW4_9FUNG|nr:hypothetical protein BASA62_003492 [Batrachochytrium salamandrivorans]KAH6582955.1 hypothetical protein BASA60_001678 [Batrachochytrium salamandrivorans]KAH6587223.1 hypothetical protein BASA50_001356 [Batrachochytrium salamandrivorans]
MGRRSCRHSWQPTARYTTGISLGSGIVTLMFLFVVQVSSTTVPTSATVPTSGTSTTASTASTTHSTSKTITNGRCDLLLHPDLPHCLDDQQQRPKTLFTQMYIDGSSPPMQAPSNAGPSPVMFVGFAIAALIAFTMVALLVFYVLQRRRSLLQRSLHHRHKGRHTDDPMEGRMNGHMNGHMDGHTNKYLDTSPSLSGMQSFHHSNDLLMSGSFVLPSGSPPPTSAMMLATLKMNHASCSCLDHMAVNPLYRSTTSATGITDTAVSSSDLLPPASSLTLLSSTIAMQSSHLAVTLGTASAPHPPLTPPISDPSSSPPVDTDATTHLDLPTPSHLLHVARSPPSVYIPALSSRLHRQQSAHLISPLVSSPSSRHPTLNYPPHCKTGIDMHDNTIYHAAHCKMASSVGFFDDEDDDPNFDGFNGVLVPGLTGIRHSPVVHFNNAGLEGTAYPANTITQKISDLDLNYSQVAPSLPSPPIKAPANLHRIGSRAAHLASRATTLPEISSVMLPPLHESITNHTSILDSILPISFSDTPALKIDTPTLKIDTPTLKVDTDNSNLNPHTDGPKNSSILDTPKTGSLGWDSTNPHMTLDHSHTTSHTDHETLGVPVVSMPFLHQNMQLEFMDDFNALYSSAGFREKMETSSISSKSFATTLSNRSDVADLSKLTEGADSQRFIEYGV